MLRTFMGAASYVIGAHSLPRRPDVDQWRLALLTMWTGDVQPITYNAGRPVSVTLRLPSDRNNGIDRDLGIYMPGSLDAGPRHAEPRPALRPVHRRDARELGAAEPPRRRTPRSAIARTASGIRVTSAPARSRTGRTSRRASASRWTCSATAAPRSRRAGALRRRPADRVRQPGEPDRRADRGGHAPVDRPRRQRPAARRQRQHPVQRASPSASTPTFGRLTVPTTQYSPDLLRGWGKRGYNNEVTFAMQHQLADRVSVNGGYYRRTFGNQTFTDDLRYDASSYDSFCITAPSDPDLPDGGGYQVCGVLDLKPSVFALNLPANSLIRFSEDFGGETNLYQGFDVNLEARFRNGAFLQAGIAATARTFDNCNLLAAGLDAVDGRLQGTEIYPDGTTHAIAMIRIGPTRSCRVHTRCRGTSSCRHLPVHARRPDRRRRHRASSPPGR